MTELIHVGGIVPCRVFGCRDTGQHVVPADAGHFDAGLAAFRHDRWPSAETDREYPGCIPDSFTRIASWWMARKQRRSS